MIKNKKKRNEKTAQSSGKIREKNCEKNNGKGLFDTNTQLYHF